MSEFHSRSAMIRKAHSLPKGDEERRQILATIKEADLAKEAMKKGTEDFIEWVLMTQQDNPWSESQAERFLESKTGREPAPPPEKGKSTMKRGPLQEGEKVRVDARKLADGGQNDPDMVAQYDNRVGLIDKVTPEGLLVKFYKGNKERPSDELSGDKHLFIGFASGKKTSLYRWTPKSVLDEREGGQGTQFEAVYLRDKSTRIDTRRVEEVEAYIDRGSQRGESRSRVYYSGYLAKFAYNQKGQLYFRLNAQQRTDWTSLNPKKGKLLYLGVMNKRPSGWKAEAAELGILDGR